MSEVSSDDSSREQRLERVLADYLRAEEMGQPPDQQQLLSEHPDLAGELALFFRDRSAMQLMAEKIQPNDLPTLDVQSSDPFPATGELVRYFGDYELIEEIARGGMGIVYRARQVSLNRIVALKMILAGTLATKQDVQRFRAEAEAAARLDHPSIVPIYEVGEYNGKQYFSMAILGGGSLSSCIAALVKDPQRAVGLLVQICRAVHFAHQRGILHRDLKPANILLDATGAPQVSDFGLAKLVDRDSGMTQSGAIVGTPSYMAPEQARAEKDLTTSADVYALGAILYELLTGQPPFRGATPLETLRQVIEQEPVRPRTIHARIDRDLETIALKCLEKEPSRRYESAAALTDDLERWLRGEPIHARPVMLPERVWKWVKRRPMAAALAGTAAALILIVAVGGPLVKMREAQLQEDLADKAQQAKEATQIADRAQVERTSAQSERAAAQAERDAKALEAQESSAQANLRLVQAIRLGEEQGGPREAAKLLAGTASLRQPMRDLATRLGGDIVHSTDQFWAITWPQLNDEASQWLFKSSLMLERSIRLPSLYPAGGRNVSNGQVVATFDHRAISNDHRAISPDGRWLVRTGKSGEGANHAAVEIIATDTGVVTTTIDLTPPTADLPLNQLRRTAITTAFTAEGQLLVAYREQTLGSGPQQQNLLSIETWSIPQGKRLLLATVDLVAHFPASPDKRRVFSETPVVRGFHSPEIAFSADRERVTIFQPQRDFFTGDVWPAGVFEVASGHVVAKYFSSTFTPITPTPSGDKLIGLKRSRNASNDSLEIQLLDIATGKIENGWGIDRFELPRRMAVSPDGRWLAMMKREMLQLHELNGTQSVSVPLVGEKQQMLFLERERNACGPLVEFSPDGQLLTVVSAQQIHLLRVPDLTILFSRPHGLNVGDDMINQSRGLMRPLAVTYFADGRVAAGFSLYRQYAPPNEEIWQFWHASPAKLQPDPIHAGQVAINSARFFPNGHAAVISTGNRGFDAIDFSREERGIFHGPKGPEPFVRPGSRWLHYNAFEVESGFDSTGRWFVRGADIWDVSTGRKHRTFSNSRLLARSRDGRYLAMQETSLAVSVESVANLVRSAFGIPETSRVQVWDLELDREQCQFVSPLWTKKYSFVFSPDAKYLIGSGSDAGIVIGSVADGSAVGPVKGRYDSYSGLPMDPSGTKLLVNDEDENRRPVLHLVEIETGRVLMTFSASTSAFNNGLAKPVFSRSGRSLALASAKFTKGRMESQLTIWTAEGGTEAPIDLGVSPETLAFGADDTRLIVSGTTNSTAQRKVVEIWDVPGQKRLVSTFEDEGSVRGMHVSSSVGTAAVWFKPSTSDVNSRLELRELATGDIKATYPEARVMGEAQGGKLLVLHEVQSAKVSVIDAGSGKLSMKSEDSVRPIVDSPDSGILSMEWERSEGNKGPILVSPDGQVMYVNSIPQASLWHFSDGRQIAIAATRDRPVWFTPDSRQLVSKDPTTGVFSIWDTGDGRQVGNVDPRGMQTLPGGLVGGVDTVQISPDSKTIAPIIQGQTRLFDIKSGKRITALPREGQWQVRAVAVSPDAKWVASAGADGTVGVWHANDGRFAAMLDGYAGVPCAAEFAPDGKQLLTRDTTGHLALWHIESRGDKEPKVDLVWQQKKPAPAENASALAISADGRQFACGNADGKVMGCRLDTGTDEWTLAEGGGAVLSVAYRKDGQVLAVGGADGMVRLWDLTTAKKSAEWSADQGQVRAVAFQPGTDLLATAGKDVRLWQTAPPQLLQHIREPDKPLCDICFSPNGRYLLTAGEDQTAQRIDLIAHRDALKTLGLGW